MNTAIEYQSHPDATDVCTIVVLYDGDMTRTRALAACDYLVNQFWQDVELEFHWWRTDFLRDSTLATVASSNAVASDFLIVCLDSHGEIAPELESWFESWLANRSGREGALVDLTSNPRVNDDLTQIRKYLLEVSQRGNFDYLTTIPSDGWITQPTNITGGGNYQGIDEILGETRPPSHFGLNE